MPSELGAILMTMALVALLPAWATVVVYSLSAVILRRALLGAASISVLMKTLALDEHARRTE